MAASSQAVFARASRVEGALIAGQFFSDPIRCMDRQFPRFGRTLEIRVPLSSGPRPVQVWFLVGPEHNEQVLGKSEFLAPTGVWPAQGPKGSAQHSMRQSFMKSHGAEHDRVHSAVMPHLRRDRVDLKFEEVREIAIEHTRAWPIGTIVDVYALARQMMQHIAFATLFGDHEKDRIRALGKLLDEHHRLNWSLPARLLMLDVMGLPYHRMLRNAEALQQFLYRWAHERHGEEPYRDLRALFANMEQEDGTPLPMPNVAGHLGMLAFGSYGTSASNLTWALFLLAQHPTIMAELVEELSALGRVEDLDLKRLSSLPLLDAVLKETMRLITPVPFLGFRAVTPCDIAGNRLGQGSRIVISPHLTHRLPELYDAADRFIPKRWFEIKRSMYEYLPFSGGPRRCPGYWFAINNLKTALAIILMQYRVTVAPGARIDRAYSGITAPKRGLPMQLEPQDYAFQANPCTGTILDLVTLDHESPRGYRH